MKLPNFFIIGAPKAGTTALYHAFQQHPDIFMSPNKEPRYFAYDGEPPHYPGPNESDLRRLIVWKPREYAMLFAAAEHQRAVGEASTLYLRSPLAAQRIKKEIPAVRLIATLRQPAERAYSNYMFQRQRGIEPAATFQEALQQEDARAQAGWYSDYAYKINGLYHDQLSVYYDLFPREQIKVILYDDLKAAPQELMRELFRFLQVDEKAAVEIRKSNVTRLPKNPDLHHWATQPGMLDRRLPFLPRFARRVLSAVLRRADNRFNLVPPPRIDPAVRDRLTEYYREDILKLQALIGRDLSGWLKSG